MDLKDMFEYSEICGSLELKRLRPEYRDLAFIKTPFMTQEIRPNCFEGCNAQAIYISSYVKRIGAEAFKDCKQLRYVYIPKRVEVIGRDAFKGCDNVTIVCEFEETYCWVHPERHYEMYVESAGFNFHRSSGGWSEPSGDFSIGDEPRPYNPLNRPLMTHVSSNQFYEMLAKDNIETTCI